MIDSFLQCALEMRKRFPTASELDVFADIVATFLTSGTFSAWNAYLEGNSVA